ncbi:MAG: hypothetical protein ACP5FH_09025 [Terracidiphilus sp.]
MKFVRKDNLAAVRRELKKQEIMKARVDRWIGLATEIFNLRLADKRPWPNGEPGTVRQKKKNRMDSIRLLERTA